MAIRCFIDLLPFELLASILAWAGDPNAVNTCQYSRSLYPYVSYNLLEAYTTNPRLLPYIMTGFRPYETSPHTVQLSIRSIVRAAHSVFGTNSSVPLLALGERLDRKKRDVIEALKEQACFFSTLDPNEIDPIFRNDKEVIAAAAAQNGYALQYASETLRNDKELVLSIVGHCGSALQYASETLRDDEEVVVAALTRHEGARDDYYRGVALRYASERLRNNKELAVMAVSQYSAALQYVSETLKDDEDVLTAYEIRRKDEGYEVD